MSKPKPNAYAAIWPGQPGGYVPVIADAMVADSAARKQRAEAMAKGHAANAKPRRTEAVKKARKRATRDNSNAFKAQEA